ncbi:Type III pantothenate kinase [Seminavis robusta]|uniref:Type III pantothenate kinase n=1 Tax=Seminavis robusta TaxID=568900 RepID=A0A9N8HWE4_9STRA|nr:Type III pantothenate kinase [Seminavis robusta]|eukprot:Sro1638_g287770.1 Type III pantothenate kinase (702) ;mRNA; f:12844-15215
MATVNNVAVSEHRDLAKITDAVWPNACPSKHEDQVLSIVCGNTHLQWALHLGINGHFLPQLFWRTPALNSDEIAAGDPCSVLERYLPGGGHELVFGSQTAASDKAQAAKASSARRVPLLSVYVVSTNPDNEAGCEFLFRDIPCRMYRLQSSDFFSKEQGAYEGMGIDRLANIKAASKFYPYPLMVIDGGTAMTYTGADAKGNIVGGGIYPGFAASFRALHDYTGALPFIAQEEMNKMIGEAIASTDPLPLFANDTKSAMITTGIKAMAEVCWGAVAEFRKMVLQDKENAPKGTTTNEKSKDAMEVEGENGKDKDDDNKQTTEEKESEKDSDNLLFTICLTGGDGDVIARLLETDHNGILSSYVPVDARKGVELAKHKHLSHYGIGQVIDEKTTAGQALKSDDDKIREEIVGQRVAKKFKIRSEDKIFRGSIAAVADADTLDKDWFYVRYDDGDTEHLTITGLYDGLVLYKEVGEDNQEELTEAVAEKNKKKVEQASDTAKLLVQTSEEVKKYAETPAEERNKTNSARKRNAAPSKSAPPTKVAKAKTTAKKQNPISHVGLRIAKYFGDEVYFGTIKKYIQPTGKKDEDLWHIVYDDDDQEDYDAKDLRKAIALYKSNKGLDKVSRVTGVAEHGAEGDEQSPAAEDAMETEPAADDTAAAPGEATADDESKPAEEAPPAGESAAEAPAPAPEATAAEASTGD